MKLRKEIEPRFDIIGKLYPEVLKLIIDYKTVIKMKNLIATTIYLLMFMSCKGKDNPPKTLQNRSIETGKLSPEIKITDSINAKEILQKSTIRYQNTLNGYDFNLPFNYRIRFIPSEKSPGSYYKFQWKINDGFTIDSDAKGFKRFLVFNFIEYLPSGTGEGNFFIVKSNGSTQLKISDFMETTDEIFYQDKNSAIFKLYGKIKAFYFEYLPKTQEYLVYLSDTPFWNKRPEPKTNEEIDQLLNQIRMAKNIFKPIKNQDKSWDSYKNQLSVLERHFLENINTEIKNALKSDVNSESYAATDQGNSPYYRVFKINSKTNAIWEKLRFVRNSGTFAITEADKMFKYLSENNFRFFYYANYRQVDKGNFSIVYQRGSEDSFCLITKTRNNKFMIFKEFPALTTMSKDYYKNEIEFYRELFENYN